MAYFLSPRIIFGRNTWRRLGDELAGLGSKAMLITGQTMANRSHDLVSAIHGAGFKVMIWDGAQPEPSIDNAIAAGRALLDFGPQLVIGFGGGSAIDVAKVAWMLYERPALSSPEAITQVTPRSRLALRQKARLLAVPTTSGAGSEVTWAAVLSDAVTHRKVGFAHPDLVPDWALLVPEFTASMPPALTASVGLDVISHALDGYTARQQTDFSDAMCLQSLRMALEWLPIAYDEPGNMVAREKMQHAAAVAGLGFGNSNGSLSHALGHAIGAQFAISHGRAVGLSLPYSLDFLVSTAPLPGAPHPVSRLAAAARFVGMAAATDEDAVRQLIARIRELSRLLGEPQTLLDLKIAPMRIYEALESLVETAAKDANMPSSPSECQGDNLRQVLRRIGTGKA